jgi:hypothetical protein
MLTEGDDSDDTQDQRVDDNGLVEWPNVR